VFSQSKSTICWADRIAPLALLGMVGWFCDGILFYNKIPLFRDLGTYSYPIKFSLAESLRAGDLALWDNRMASGFPLLAALQSGVFYPPSLLFYFLPFFEAIQWTFFAHFLVAAWGAYFLCRHWKCQAQLSLIGALLFAMGGTTVSLANLLNHFQSAVWLPWIILSGERCFIARSWKTFLPLVIVLFCSLLAGSPEIYLFSVALLVVDIIRLGTGSKSSITRMLLLTLAANAVVVVLGMIQFLPTLELFLQSRRDRAIPFQEASYWSLNPISLLGLLLPDKEVDDSLPLGVRLFFAREVPFLLSHYLGLLSVLGIAAWAYFAVWRQRITLLAMLIVSLVLALGSFTPVYSFFFKHVPLFRIVRFPEKFFFVSYALLAYIVLNGLIALDERRETHGKFPMAVLLGLFMSFVAVYAFCRHSPESLSYLISYFNAEAATAMTLASVLFGLERQIGLTTALALAYFCRWRNLLGTQLQRGFLILIVLFDLGTAHKPLLFPLDTATVTDTERVLPDGSSRGYRLFYYTGGRNLHPASVTVYGYPSFSRGAALSFENLLPNAGIFHGVEYFQEIDALTRQPYNDFLDFANLLSVERRADFLRALNVRYVVSFERLEVPGMHLVKSFPEHFSWLYELADPVPRTYIASQAVYEPEISRTLEILASREFEPRTHVVLSEKVPMELAAASAGGEAQIVQYSRTRVTIEALLRTSGVLVLTDAYYPGWKVVVNGKEKRILRANHFFRGVALAAGKHRVEFVYQPLSFRIGAAVSATTLIILIGTLLIKTVALRCQWTKSITVRLSGRREKVA
jgi:hypothetical protein